MVQLSSERKRQRRRHRRRVERHALRSGPPWDVPGVGVPIGNVIVDRDYVALDGAKHRIVTSVNAKVTFGQACVDVHLGTEGRRLSGDRTQEVVPPSADDTFLIQAGDVLAIESQERFQLPDDVQGQVSPKAKLTTLGLFFPTTHVDPGFSGKLFLPIINAGPRAVAIPVGEAVGKVELQRLNAAVQEPWKGSSGFGNFQGDWVVPGLTVAEQRDQVIARMRLLQWSVMVLALALAALSLGPVISGWLSGLRLGDFAEKVLATVLAAGMVSVVTLIIALTRTKGKGLRNRFRLEADDKR